jgi:hypothetical protein
MTVTDWLLDADPSIDSDWLRLSVRVLDWSGRGA